MTYIALIKRISTNHVCIIDKSLRLFVLTKRRTDFYPYWFLRKYPVGKFENGEHGR